MQSVQQITSTKNSRIRAMRDLRDGKARAESGLFLVEGAKLCAEALRDAQVDTLLVDQERTAQHDALMRQSRCVLSAPQHVVAHVCSAKTPQGICASVRMPPPLDLDAARGALLVLDGVQDPGNVGAMIRTAEATGFGAVLLSEACADAFAPKVVQASMGSVLRLPLWRGALAQALDLLKGRGFQLISAELGGQPFFEAARGISAPFALVIGSEGGGVSDAISQRVDFRVSLPMRGRAESLNAAVAAGILMYGIINQET